MRNGIGVRSVSMFLVLILLLGAFVITQGEAEAAQDGDYTYTTSGFPLVATITGYTGAGGAITIPSTLGGYSVVAIGKDAFKYSDSLTSVTMPGSIRTIGNHSFEGCSDLISLVIGDNVSSIGNSAFIGCVHLTSVIIPDRVHTIGDYAFYYCHGITSLTLGDHVKTIGIDAFVDTSLTSVEIPASVTFIGSWAFGSNDLLTSIIIDPDNDNYASIDGVLYNKDITILILCPNAKTGALTIPDTVTYLDNGSFAYCSLTSVDIPDSVTSFGYDTFTYSEHLTSIAIPSAATIISSGMFRECHALASIAFDAPDQIMWIGQYAFDHCTNLTSIVLPENVWKIYGYAFNYCTNLTSVTIPDRTRAIDSEAFAHCTNLTSIVIPDAVATIYQSTFEYCISLASVSIGSGVEHIFERAFYYCSSLDYITIPANVKKIDDEVFRSCTSLTSINFLGLTAPTDVPDNWILYTPAGIRGHAYPTSNFPAPGESFHGLTMGSQLPLTVPEASKNLNAMPGVAQVTLTWEAPANNGGSNITNYNVYRSTASGGTYTLVSSPTGLNLTDPGLTNGQTYWYKVSAENAIGEGPNCTPVNATPSVVITVPGAPRDLDSIVYRDQVNLTWEVPLSDGGSPITAYRLYRSSTSSAGPYAQIASTTEKEYSDMGLINDTAYFYKVSAVNTIGEGANCTSVGAFILFEPFVPGAPENLVLTAGDAQVTLTWEAPASDGGSNITYYHVYRSTASNGTFVLISSPTGLSYTDIGLVNDQTYWYKVGAENAIGEGAPSLAASVVPHTSSSASDLMLILEIVGIAVVLVAVILVLRKRRGKV